METIEFTVFDHGRARIEMLQKRLDEFEAQSRIKVHLDVLPWAGSWSKMVQIALYKDGPDISEMGSTWIGDFVQMNALRAFIEKEIAILGGEAAFLKPSWISGGVNSDYPDPKFTLWGMPWLADVRVFAYRKDFYEKAGVDPQQAFKTLASVEQALTKLQAAKVKMPLVIPTLRSRLDLQMLASWVWSEGGDFLNEASDQVLFDNPEALRGFTRYFELGRFLSSHARGLNDDDSNDQFYNGRAATTMGGHWLILDPRAVKNLAGKIDVIGIPPVAFVGGSHLVIWKHSRKENAALKLIEFLAGKRTPPEFYPSFGFPARHDAIENASFMEDEKYRAMVAATRSGRTIAAGRLWGMMEKRLVDLMPVIWQEVLASKNSNVDAIVKKRITGLAARLRMGLST